MIISWLVPFLICAVVGYFLSRWIPLPRQPLVWLLWLIGLVVSQFILVSAKIISTPGFTIYGNTLLQGLIFGILAAFLIREEKNGVAQT